MAKIYINVIIVAVQYNITVQTIIMISYKIHLGLMGNARSRNVTCVYCRNNFAFVNIVVIIGGSSHKRDQGNPIGDKSSTEIDRRSNIYFVKGQLPSLYSQLVISST